MRVLSLLPLALVTAGCWTPGPSQVDPTRYPWAQPVRGIGEHGTGPIVARGKLDRQAPFTDPALQPLPPKPDECVISLETGGGRDGPQLGCN